MVIETFGFYPELIRFVAREEFIAFFFSKFIFTNRTLLKLKLTYEIISAFIGETFSVALCRASHSFLPK
jgi:hypothetical protein